MAAWLHVSVATLAIALPVAASRAEVTEGDLKLLARAMSFLDRPPVGAADIGIVYPAGSAVGLAEARRIAGFFGEGLRSGQAVLRPRLLTLEEARQAEVAAMLLTEAALAQADALAQAAAGRGVLTVSTSRAVAERGAVVMAIRAGPQVEILANRRAAQAAGIRFANAFRMLIQER